MSNHDEHYRRIEEGGLIEPIERMESTICLGIPQEHHATLRRNLNLAMADKHMSRAGEKAGEDANKEIEKAENYLCRARTGSWRPKPSVMPWTPSVEPEQKEVLVTTHGKTAEVIEAEVGRAVAELKATVKNCRICKHCPSGRSCQLREPCENYSRWEPKL